MRNRAVESAPDDVLAPLAHVELGDIVVLPDGRAMTVRARVTLPSPEGSMAGFLICGEMEILLSTPSFTSGPVNVYVPIDYLPESAAKARTVCEGAASYWAPHLPAMSGAMGEILYRVVEVRGSIDPIVIVYRGPEVIVFIRATYARSCDLQVLAMSRHTGPETDVTRHAGVVDPVVIPVQVPVLEPNLYEHFVR